MSKGTSHRAAKFSDRKHDLACSLVPELLAALFPSMLLGEPVFEEPVRHKNRDIGWLDVMLPILKPGAGKIGVEVKTVAGLVGELIRQVKFYMNYYKVDVWVAVFCEPLLKPEADMLKSAGILPVVIPDFAARYEGLVKGKPVDTVLVHGKVLDERQEEMLQNAAKILDALGHNIGGSWHDEYCALCAVHEALYEIIRGCYWTEDPYALVADWAERLHSGPVDFEMAYGSKKKS